jgi:prepilin-type N-terminal cleavage/methylation domain-containing protein
MRALVRRRADAVLPDAVPFPFSSFSPRVRQFKRHPVTHLLRCPRRAQRVGAHGFTLVELMIVVLIISVLATITVPAVQRIQRKAKATTIMNDFRVFGAAFDTYAQEMGGWPAETAAGVFPPEMAQRMNQTAWLRKTPMGGQYNWENNQMHFGVTYRAAIAIAATAGAPLPLDVNQLYDLEHGIDGANQINWLGGTFHLGTGLVPLYIVQP